MVTPQSHVIEVHHAIAGRTLTSHTNSRAPRDVLWCWKEPLPRTHRRQQTPATRLLSCTPQLFSMQAQPGRPGTPVSRAHQPPHGRGAPVSSALPTTVQPSYSASKRTPHLHMQPHTDSSGSTLRPSRQVPRARLGSPALSLLASRGIMRVAPG